MMTAEKLAAFADGELSPEDAAAVVMHLADHPEDQALVDDIMAANALLARAFDAPLYEPIPQSIHAAIFADAGAGAPPAPAPAPASALASALAGEGAQVLAFRRRGGPVLAALAVAASVAVVALILQTGPQGADPLVPGPVAEGSALHQAVSTLPSLQTTAVDGQDLTVLASLPVEGGFCREVELIAPEAQRLTMALICRRGGGDWVTEVALIEPLPDAVEGFVPAGGVETMALTPWLDRFGAGQVLTGDKEQAAIAAGWAGP